jgi:hypothetical protein
MDSSGVMRAEIGVTQVIRDIAKVPVFLFAHVRAGLLRQEQRGAELNRGRLGVMIACTHGREVAEKWYDAGVAG